MHREISQAPFVDRFDGIRSSVLRAEVLRGACWTLVTAACGLALLAGADYLLELAWAVRAIALGVVVSVAWIVAVVRILRPALWWSRPRTAVEIERRFPQLGQRVRTVVQFSGRRQEEVAAEGVAPKLVTALEEETHHRAAPLELRTIVPRRQLAAAALSASAAVLLLSAGALLDWQWGLAVRRALLGDAPYTRLAVQPGHVLVDQGDDVTLSLRLAGRTDRSVMVCWRGGSQPDAPWQEMQLSPDDARVSAADRTAEYETTLSAVEHPTEYRVEAGPARSEVYRIDVRYPLAVTKFEAALTPPGYTGVPAETVPGGDLDVIEGTNVEFQIEFDRPCTEAFVDFAAVDFSSEEERAPKTLRLPLVPQQGPEAGGNGRFTCQLRLSEDKVYSIAAAAREGLPLQQNRYRIRVRPDLPPRVRFEDPDESLEVHPLAEVLMRVRTSDDFGLSKAGIVFQVANGQEQTLTLEDFLKAARQSDADVPALTTRAMLEEVLPLEDFALTPTQAVTYYAFAEDNFPGGARRTETDLRFIDIRSFMRIYKLGGT